MIVNILAGLVALVGLIFAISGVRISINPSAFFKEAMKRTDYNSPIGSAFPDVKKSAFTRIALGIFALVLGVIVLIVRLH